MGQADDELLALLRRRDCTLMEIRGALRLTEGQARSLIIRMTYACPEFYEYRTRVPGCRGIRVRYGLLRGDG